MDISIKDLQCFVQVVDCGGFSKAAQTLYISQPALSRKMHALEDEIGLTLLTCTTRHVEPTEAGLALYRHAQRVLSSMDSLEHAMMELHRAGRSTLRLGYGSNGQFSYALRLIAGMHQHDAAVQITVQGGDALEELEAGSVDAALLMACEAEGQDWLEGMPLETAGLSVFLPRHSPLAKQETVHMAQIMNQRFVLPVRRNTRSCRPGGTLSDGIRAFLNSCGVPDVQIGVAAGSQLFSACITNEQALGVMPDSSRSIENEVICCRPIAECRTGFHVVLCWRRRDAQMKVIRALCEVAKRIDIPED